MKPRTAISLLGATSLVTASVLAAQPTTPTPDRPAPSAPAPASVPPADAADFSTRLARLDPSDPLGYFTLGEELADSAAEQSTAARRAGAVSLARRLFVLSAHLASRRPSADNLTLRHSAYLALASIADNTEERRWLRAVASTAEPPRQSVRWEPAPRALAADAGMYDLAVALGRYRSGEFRRVRDALRRHPNAKELLTRIGVDARRADALISLLETDTSRAPQACMRCKGDRVIRTFVDGTFTTELCPQCLGNPAPVPALSSGAFAEQLRVESALLGASPSSWSAQAGVVGFAPVRDIDPAAVAAHYGVDTNAPIHRDGSWWPRDP
ncbi:MAG: hypothetical protein ACKVZJ_00665 [Phycisphaerales bacterium]